MDASHSSSSFLHYLFQGNIALQISMELKNEKKFLSTFALFRLGYTKLNTRFCCHRFYFFKIIMPISILFKSVVLDFTMRVIEFVMMRPWMSAQCTSESLFLFKLFVVISFYCC